MNNLKLFSVCALSVFLVSLLVFWAGTDAFAKSSQKKGATTDALSAEQTSPTSLAEKLRKPPRAHDNMSNPSGAARDQNRAGQGSIK